MLVRGAGLADSMSRYLIRRIEENPSITLHTHTEIEEMEGAERLERVVWQRKGAAPEKRDIGHVFLMTGASPNTAWLEGCLALDDKGFVRTGTDLAAPDLAAAGWPCRARPTSSKPAGPACSPPATCAPAASSASPRRWARARAACSSSTAY